MSLKIVARETFQVGRPLVVDADTLAIDAIEEVGPGGDWSAMMPAASLDPPVAVRRSPLDEPIPEGAIRGQTITGRDVAWVRAAIRRPEPARSAVPLRVA